MIPAEGGRATSGRGHTGNVVWTRNAPQKTSAAMAAIFSSISRLCVALPCFTPRQLMMVRMPSATAATIQSGQCAPVSTSMYFAKVMETAAMPPVCVTSSNPQP